MSYESWQKTLKQISEEEIQALRCGVGSDNCDGFECTAHCCVLRCILYPEHRVCPDLYTLRRCPKNFKGRRLG